MTPAFTETAESILNISIDKRSPVPVYVQISDAIRSLIRSGELGPDSILPPSKLVCERFAITRMTLRHAYSILDREGLLDAQRGRGTFVRRPPIERPLTRLIGFSEEMLARGKKPSSKVLAFEQTTPSDAARQFLGNGPVFRIERLRLADGVPIAIEEVQIPVPLCRGLERFDFGKHSLYEVLNQVYRLQFDRCEQVVTASIPDRRQKLLLEIGSKVALLNVTRQSFTKSDRPATYGVTHYRGDRYTAAVHGERGPLSGTRG
jgi:GntR family transcriptional regulator